MPEHIRNESITNAKQILVYFVFTIGKCIDNVIVKFYCLQCSDAVVGHKKGDMFLL